MTLANHRVVILKLIPWDVWERLAALKKFEYRRAALEQPAELSGLRPSEYQDLREKEIATKYPDIVSGTAEALQAVEVVRQALKAADQAVSNELIASGGTIAEPVAAQPSKAWA